MRKMIVPAVLLMFVALALPAFGAGEAGAADPTDEPAVASIHVPRVISGTQVTPSYPPAALSARFEGWVVMSATVFADGTVGEMQVLETSKPGLGFEQAARAALKQWRFEPATQGGEPMDYVAVARLNFRAPGRGYPNGFVTGGIYAPVQPGPSGGRFGATPDVPADRGPSTSAIQLRGGLQKVELPPCAFGDTGCTYDRRDLFLIPFEQIEATPLPGPVVDGPSLSQ